MTNADGYVFGYGSLIERRSRGRNVRDLSAASPVRVRGLRRAWNVASPPPGLGCTYLGVVADVGSTCNGVLAAVAADEWAGLDRRERGYRRVGLDIGAIEWLAAEGAGAVDRPVYYYEVMSPTEPTAERPIIQSYLDICLEGCLRVGEELGVGEAFAEEFLATTGGWSEHWVNDRIFPRAAHRTLPDAPSIDRLAHARAPAEFAAMRVE